MSFESVQLGVAFSKVSMKDFPFVVIRFVDNTFTKLKIILSR